MLHGAREGLLVPPDPRLLRLRVGPVHTRCLLMPQLDVCSFLNQVVWLTAVFVSLVSLFYSTLFTSYTKANWSRIAFSRLLRQVPATVFGLAGLARPLPVTRGLFEYATPPRPLWPAPSYKKGTGASKASASFYSLVLVAHECRSCG